MNADEHAQHNYISALIGRLWVGLHSALPVTQLALLIATANR